VSMIDLILSISAEVVSSMNWLVQFDLRQANMWLIGGAVVVLCVRRDVLKQVAEIS